MVVEGRRERSDASGRPVNLDVGLATSGRADEGPKMTLFEKIVARQIPAKIVYEDDLVLAFWDIHPQAPVHLLVIPKRMIPRIGSVEPEDAVLLGHLLAVVPEVARRVGVAETGYRLVINNGSDGGETVPHLHCHLLGGRPLSWPPG